MPKRWSKLQTRLYNLMDPNIHFQIHCSLYEMNSNNGYHGSKLPRYFVTVGKEIVFDYPKDFVENWETNTYIWDGAVSRISDLIEEYIQRPEAELLSPFKRDEWGITDLLRVCDRRIGVRRLRELRDKVKDERLLKIIDRRLGATGDVSF